MHSYGTQWFPVLPRSTGLRIIEVQTGEYPGEDDIVRFADMYGRVRSVFDKEDLPELKLSTG